MKHRMKLVIIFCGLYNTALICSSSSSNTAASKRLQEIQEIDTLLEKYGSAKIVKQFEAFLEKADFDRANTPPSAECKEQRREAAQSLWHYISSNQNPADALGRFGLVLHLNHKKLHLEGEECKALFAQSQAENQRLREENAALKRSCQMKDIMMNNMAKVGLAAATINQDTEQQILSMKAQLDNLKKK